MMNSVIARIKFNKNDSLTSLVKKNAFYSLVLKILSVILGFWSVKVAFDFTGSKQVYGLWLTILSVVSWLGLLNGGLGNGLRNKLSRSIATDNYREAKAYVSTSYVFIGVISFIFVMIFMIFTLYFDWRILFNANYISKVEFTGLFLVVVISYFLQLTLSTVNAVCYAFNRSTLPSFFTFLSNLIYVLSLYLLKYFDIKGFFILGLMYSISIIIVLLVVNVYLFSGKYSDIKPSIKSFKKKYIKELIGNGIKFFFLETSAVIIFATDSMVITHVVGSEGVTIYQLVMKLFSIFTTVSGTIMVPLWSAFTHAYSKGDIAWIKKIMRKILLMVIPLVSGVIVFTFLVNPILKIWIGNGIIAPKILICTIALYIIINIWSNIFAYFLNGVNKINGQLLTVGIGAVVNIPLSLFFSKTVGLGTVGVVLGTILSLLPFSILGPINTYLVIKRASK